MEDNRTAIHFRMDCDSVESWLRIWLASQNFLVVLSFELDSACSSSSDLTCPHHPGEPCECQLLILGVYRDDIGPFPLVLHGHRNETGIFSTGSRPFPVALERCLEEAHHNGLTLLDKLTKNLSEADNPGGQ